MSSKTASSMITGDSAALKVLVYPRRFRTSLCRSFSRTNACQYGDKCSFAHGSHELRSSDCKSDSVFKELPTIQECKTIPQAQHCAVKPIAPSATGPVPESDKKASTERNSKKEGTTNSAIRCDPKLYKTELCRTFLMTKECPYTDKCQFAHGSHEIRVYRQNGKVSSFISKPVAPGAAPKARRAHKSGLCYQFQKNNRCEYGDRCQFAHGTDELRGASEGRATAVEVNIQPRPRHVETAAILLPSNTGALPNVRVPLVFLHDRSMKAEANDSKTICDPRLYKTEMCRTYQVKGHCTYEQTCRFAHGINELRSRVSESTPAIASLRDAGDKYLAKRRVKQSEESLRPRIWSDCKGTIKPASTAQALAFATMFELSEKEGSSLTHQMRNALSW